ncbi:MAG: hypothetical protein MUD12_09525 [Spirochaetes bacterium]|jgi:hypothetical protein|nr:hypothetical protein [Spirochaetota bacterium]
MLVGNGIISHDQMEVALGIQSKNCGQSGMILVEKGYLQTGTLHEFLMAQNRRE